MKGYFTAEVTWDWLRTDTSCSRMKRIIWITVGNAKKTLNFHPTCDIMSILGILYAHAEKSENTNGR